MPFKANHKKKLKRDLKRQAPRKKNSMFYSYKPYNIKPEPFPRVMFTRVKHVGNIQLTTWPTTANTREYIYRLNSPYDPDESTGVGSYTAQGWPALQGIYANYQVMGAKFSIAFNNPSVDGLRVGYSLVQESGLSNQTLETNMNLPLTYVHGLNNTGSQRKVFTGFVRPWSLIRECQNKQQYLLDARNEYAATVTANPVNTCRLRVFVAGDTTAQASQTVSCLVKIVYYVRMFGRQQLTRSQF